MNEYLTIKNETEGFYKEKGSKFLAFAYPVATLESVEKRLAELRKAYHDARHHCYAYVLGLKEQQVRANDDGEPSHSAGDPILGQIRSHGLTNTLVVVVRYFGGIKLGVGGLIAAYKAAANEALSQCTTEKIYSKKTFRLSFGYEETSQVGRILRDFDIEYLEKNYEATCVFVGKVRDEEAELMLSKFDLMQASIELIKG